MRIYAQRMTQTDINLIARAIKRDNRLSLADALKDIYTCKSALYLIGASVVTLQQSNDGLHIAQMAGRLKDVPAISQLVDKLAKELNKHRIHIDGRPGWRRALKQYGYEQHGKLLSMVIL